ncbi:MAG: helix-turn-helix domain-containing protein [Prolixibacteraceae bacterium]|nr:helix-turn-helix domain-containing protein [Prolixibacteraceae bacterium]
MEEIEKRLSNIENMLLSQKNALTFDEGAIFTGIGKSHLYKLTSGGIVPHYKPRGKMIYFDRAELEKWLLQNRVTPADEIEAMANTYIATGRKGVNHV